ncbi:DMT family transporter [Lentibacter algarum]|uniref:DMT family transporter n=1 Tax=Lentibacter algarum TaxID=576131 RepID=UPI001C08C1BC|nr:DMT family transporter [Lentibacter algarum]MBU2982790.1 DMT family transporter [Lentibacter algarum]
MNNLRGILLITLAMAAFAIEDSFIKALSGTVSRGQILLMLGAGGALVFFLLALRKGENVIAKNTFSKALIWRTLSESVAALFFITSLSLLPLSTVAAVFQATPLAITLGAALFMGEQVGWRRWSAIIVGFIGVLIIIRPGFEGFQPASLFVIITVFAIAARDLLTRLIPEGTSSTVVSFYGFLSLVIASPALLAVSAAPRALAGFELGYILAAICFGVVGYYMIVAAMRTGDTASIMPFRYTRLIFSIILGAVFFRESPDALTYLGSAIVIGSGLYTFLRERQLAKVEAQTAL